MEQIIALAFIFLAYVLPLSHVALTHDIVERPKDRTCPFSPRAGWIVIILFIGPIGWLMFIRSRKQYRKSKDSAANL